LTHLSSALLSSSHVQDDGSFEEYLASENLIPRFFELLGDIETIPDILEDLTRAIINLQMLPLLVEMALHGNERFRSASIWIFCYICSEDHSILTVDPRLLETFALFIRDLQGLKSIYQVSSILEPILDFIDCDYRLVMSSGVLKDLLGLLPWRNQVEKFFLRLLRNSITKPEMDGFLQYLVEIEVLSFLIGALHDETRSDEISEIEEEIKDVIRAVMRSNQRYQEMVSVMEIPEILLGELMQGVNSKRKREEVY
jgi:hypothetical protein